MLQLFHKTKLHVPTSTVIRIKKYLKMFNIY
ncbi:MAG: hypothetical protein RL757_889, partial [Bacteroidota bacterium]